MFVPFDLDLLKTFGQIAAPAGIAIGSFLYLGRDIDEAEARHRRSRGFHQQAATAARRA